MLAKRPPQRSASIHDHVNSHFLGSCHSKRAQGGRARGGQGEEKVCVRGELKVCVGVCGVCVGIRDGMLNMGEEGWG